VSDTPRVASPAPASPPEAACPLCGGDNACAMAAEGGAGECWCSAARIAPEALARLPEAERGLRCICARCAGTAPPDAPAR